MAGFSSTVRRIPSSGFTGIRPPRPSKPSTALITRPPTSGVPKQTQVQGGPVRYAGPPIVAKGIPLPPIKGIPLPPSATVPPGNPGQTPGTSATTTASGQGPAGPLLDATALNNIATHQFDVNNKINAANTSIGGLRTGLQAALGQLAYQQPRDQLAEEQAANRSGALYSTAYNQRLGDLNNKYQTRQSGLTTTEGQEEGKLTAEIEALLGGVPLYNQGQENAAVTRAIQAALANPATGQDPAVQTPGAQPKTSKQPKASSAPKGWGPPPPEQQITTHPQLPRKAPHRPHVIDPFHAKPRPHVVDPFKPSKKKGR